MAIPKLALIPSGVKAGKLYSVLPTNGDGDFTTTRNTVATRVNENGLIEEVASNVPRLDYSDGGCPSLLLEPQSTNLITYSEQFDNADWVKLGQGIGSVPIITPNYAISPDGTLNASRLQCDLNGSNTTNDRSWLYQEISTITGNNTLSLYVKNNSNEDITFSLTNGSSETVLVLSDDKWHRLSTVRSSGGQPRIGLIGGVGASNNADLLIYGAQLEENSYATSYIKTVGTTQTRVADTANGAGDASTFNDSEGVLMAEISFLDSDGSDVSPFWQRISISDNSDTNRLFISNTLTENQIQVFVRNATGISFNKTVTISDNTLYNKIVLKYKANDFALWINGFELETDNTFDYVPSGLNVLKFSGATSYPFYGNTKQLQYFDSALNDSELEKLTSWTSFTAMANGQSYTII